MTHLTIHYLYVGARLQGKPTNNCVVGGEQLFGATSYGACWAQLRLFVETGAIPFKTCKAALDGPYIIWPPAREPNPEYRAGGWKRER